MVRLTRGERLDLIRQAGEAKVPGNRRLELVSEATRGLSQAEVEDLLEEAGWYSGGRGGGRSRSRDEESEPVHSLLPIVPFFGGGDSGSGDPLTKENLPVIVVVALAIAVACALAWWLGRSGCHLLPGR